jgi:hypothetical protein
MKKSVFMVGRNRNLLGGKSLPMASVLIYVCVEQIIEKMHWEGVRLLYGHPQPKERDYMERKMKFSSKPHFISRTTATSITLTRLIT